MQFQSVCVFCGSNPGARPDYLDAAQQLGQFLLDKQIKLVYGGASVGAMGLLAKTVQEGGGEITGVIPRALVEAEVANTQLSDLRVVNSMHKRKALMAELSDAFIALPGGFGTLEEFLEVTTWAQLGLHFKPCGLLNVCGYYDGLLQFLDHTVSEKLVRAEHREMILVAPTAPVLFAQFEKYCAPQVGKWTE